jgi:CheY-like chemotaxis protein
MDVRTARFRVLLAEDDPVSRAFLDEAIRACGGEPVACADGPSALAQARAGHWDLLVLDHHLPGLDGNVVLAVLRTELAPGARLPPAIATSAEPDTARAGLLEAGFARVVPKPLALDDLRTVLADFGCRPEPLDDAAAMRVCGSASTVERLRRLFAEQELPRIQHEFEQLGADGQAFRPTLHRLRASCGFCGATALAQASDALLAALASGAAPKRLDAARAAFGRALQATRVALHAPTATTN